MVKFKYLQIKSILQDKEVLYCLNGLHENFVVFSFVKVFNNVPIICKKFYMSENYFLKFAYMVITTTHVIFQINMLLMSFLIISSFVNVQSKWQLFKMVFNRISSLHLKNIFNKNFSRCSSKFLPLFGKMSIFNRNKKSR